MSRGQYKKKLHHKMNHFTNHFLGEYTFKHTYCLLELYCKHVHTKTFTQIFISVIFKIGQNWKQTRSTATEK